MLIVSNISKAYGANQVLNNVSFVLNPDQKMGLVGANGVGKSTLLKIIMGEIEPDGGTTSLAQDREAGYLPQVLVHSRSRTIDELIYESQGSLKQLEARMRQLEQAMAGVGNDLDGVLDEYSEIAERFERRGGYDLDHRIEQVFAGLEIQNLPRNRRVDTLSGGEKARVGLAALLLHAPDVMLLDEPTNHLDFAALEWLEDTIKAYQGAVLVVSHDRQFLNRTIDSILEIAEHTREARQYSGDYDAFAQVKRRERAKWIEDYWAQQEEIRMLRQAIKARSRHNPFSRAPRDNDKFAYTFKAERMQEAISRDVRAAEERLRRIEENPIPRPPETLKINPDFDPQFLTSRSSIQVSQIGKSYAGRPVLQDVSFILDPDNRIAIVGPNGAGKSTLLKILAGREVQDTGEVILAGSAVVGYLDQEQETLTEDGTLFEAYREGLVGDWETLKAELLRYGLFVYPDLLKPVATLSVGQKRKLQIARLMAQRANLLLLDEPTNHISLDVLEEFEEALLAFPGPIIAISHDRRFIQRFTNEVWEMRAGRLRRYAGGWDVFRQEGSAMGLTQETTP